MYFVFKLEKISPLRGDPSPAVERSTSATVSQTEPAGSRHVLEEKAREFLDIFERMKQEMNDARGAMSDADLAEDELVAKWGLRQARSDVRRPGRTTIRSPYTPSCPSSSA